MLGMLSTIIRGRQQNDRKSATHGKIALAQWSTDNVNFCTRSRPYQREASRPSGPGRLFLRLGSLSQSQIFQIWVSQKSRTCELFKPGGLIRRRWSEGYKRMLMIAFITWTRTTPKRRHGEHETLPHRTAIVCIPDLNSDLWNLCAGKVWVQGIGIIPRFHEPSMKHFSIACFVARICAGSRFICRRSMPAKKPPYMIKRAPYWQLRAHPLLVFLLLIWTSL